MKTSLIITTYNRPDALELVLKSVLLQSVMPDEVLIGDDGSGDETAILLKKYKSIFPVPLIHIWQEDKGFRVSRIRNLCFAKARFDYLISIDGDIIIHRDFVKSHILFSEKNTFLQGHRAMLNGNLTAKAIKHSLTSFSFFEKGIKNRKNTIHNIFLSKIFSKKSKNPKGIIAASMSFWKKDVFNVNGYNEDFEGWGKEDTEFGIRLMNSGVLKKDLRFCAVAYHLDHSNSSKNKYKDNLDKNLSILQDTIDKKAIKCQNGIIKL